MVRPRNIPTQWNWEETKSDDPILLGVEDISRRKLFSGDSCTTSDCTGVGDHPEWGTVAVRIVDPVVKSAMMGGVF